MEYQTATDKLLTDLVVKRLEETLEFATDTPGTRPMVLKGVFQLVAPNFVRSEQPSSPGQLAQGLSDWHRVLQDLCVDIFRHLTSDSEGPMLGRVEANNDEELQVLQALRRGVKASRNDHARKAHRTRHSLSGDKRLWNPTLDPPNNASPWETLLVIDIIEKQ